LAGSGVPVQIPLLLHEPVGAHTFPVVQFVLPGTQLPVHMPLTHAFVGHVSPHAPQLPRSIDSLTHVAVVVVLFGHAVVPGVLHPQTPPLQVRAAGQL
jgi:hypothetical protein